MLPYLPVKWCLDNSIGSQITMPVSAQDLSSALSPVSAPSDVIFDILLAEENLSSVNLPPAPLVTE
jgi:osomolarity two-component system sensor histidine kinase NIK1